MQDKIVADIGRIAITKMGGLEPYQFFVQDAFPEKDNYPVVLGAFAVDENNRVSYKGIDIENASRKSFQKYGYRKGSPRGGDITFSTKMSEAFATKLRTLRINQLPGIQMVADQSGYHNEKEIWQSFDELLANEEVESQFLYQLLEVFGGLDKDQKKGSLFSLRFDFYDGSEKYVGDFKTFQTILLANGTQDKSEKYGVKSEGYDSLCSVCLQQKPLLYGFASPFKYFTVDKPGFVTGFFKQENTWKNYPICSDCSLPFELGRDYISQNLQSYFYGRSFYMIPKLAVGGDARLYEGLLSRLASGFAQISIDKAQKLERSEDRIMEMVADKQDYYYVNLMFFEEDSKTKAIKIRLLLEEVLPSRFRKLFVTLPAEVNGHPFYENAITEKKVRKDLTFNFGIIKSFFDDDFLEVVQKVFDGQSMSRELLFSKFMQLIRENYNKQQSGDYAELIGWTVLKAHMTLRYLQKLKIISHQSYTYMDTFDQIEKAKAKSTFKYDEFKAFVNHNIDFFDNDTKVGVFGLGMLVKYTMSIQYSKLKSTPFEKKLKGYDLSMADLSRLYTEVLDKLRQYDSSGAYPELREQVLPKFFLNKHNPDHVSKNELSLYFVAGLELAAQFKVKSEKEDQQANP